jgi:hypothetical protein
MSKDYTGKSYARVIGKEPPGIGTSPKLLYLERPRYNRVAGGWDTCEELFWAASMDLAQISDGAERTSTLKTFAALPTTGRFWVTGWNQVGNKAGRPIIRVMSKGWYETKADVWEARRSTSGNKETMELGGFSYAVRTYFTTNTIDLNYSVLSAPPNTTATTMQFGLGANIIGPTYMTTWPYFFTGASPGWFLSGREIEPLPTTRLVNKVIDTFTRFMKNDGTNGI